MHIEAGVALGFFAADRLATKLLDSFLALVLVRQQGVRMIPHRIGRG